MKNWEEKFDEKFTVQGRGQYFFDIVLNRSEEYVEARKPIPQEIKQFISELLESERKKYKDEL